MKFKPDQLISVNDRKYVVGLVHRSKVHPYYSVRDVESGHITWLPEEIETEAVLIGTRDDLKEDIKS